MGCAISYSEVHPNFDEPNSALFVKPFTPTPSDSLWKLLPSSPEARMRFVDDGTLNSKDLEPGHLELRFILEDPMSQNYVGKYAEQLQVMDLFMCWIDIQEFKSILTDNYRRSKALHIYHKYIEIGAEWCVGGIADAMRQQIKELLELSEAQPILLTLDFYDKVQSTCFIEMYHNIYVPFKQTREFEELAGKLRMKYNRVRIEDFDYFGRLGDNTEEGFIARCRKKSTGKYYAMKIQSKKDLLDNFKNDYTQIDQEKQAFSTFQHPFIVAMDYAFQTDSLAIIATALATQVNLRNIQETSQLGRLTEDRVQFYAAEVVLALSYVHSMGMIYRDLKPQNILMDSDGHILLADVGGIMYENGVVLRHYSPTSILAIFAKSDPVKRQLFSSGAERADETKRMKRISVNGSIADMAPEMVILMHEKRKAMYDELRGGSTGSSGSGHDSPPKQQKYNKCVDWWSLGITLYTLLTGQRPFKDEQFQDFVDMVLESDIDRDADGREYAELFQEPSYPTYVSPAARNLISRLLDVNERTRLGAGEKGDDDIKAHPFFAGVDWNELELRHVEPPVAPLDYLDLVNETPYLSLADLMGDHDMQHMLDDPPPPELQKHFIPWDFTSTHTIRVESGLAHIMDQYDQKTKIRRVLGEVNASSNGSSPTVVGNYDQVGTSLYRVTSNDRGD